MENKGFPRKRRLYKHSSGKNEKATDSEEDSPLIKIFRNYQMELDAKYDKYERLVKKSRDLTIESKRIIFLLHRIIGEGNKEEILKEAEKRFTVLFTDTINAILSELTQHEVYQFIRAFSAGLQEFVEALGFYFYLKNGTLASITDVHKPEFITELPEVLKIDEEQGSDARKNLTLSEILIPPDFVLGIADLTGELMRKCINSVANGDLNEPFKLCDLLQNIYSAFLINDNYPKKELKRKIFTLKNSLQKVENACYAIKIRGTETPKHMLADFFSNENDFNENIENEV